MIRLPDRRRLRFPPLDSDPGLMNLTNFEGEFEDSDAMPA
jgi:hypothetical protein